MSLAKGGHHTRSVDLVVAASEVLKGKGQVLVDSLGAYKLHEATIIGRDLDQLGNVGWWEDVLKPEDVDGYARLADALDLPICAGEQLSNRFDFRDLFNARAADIINPDPSRIGITETKRIAVLADIHNLLWSPHSSMGSAPYRAAALHLCVSTPNAVILEGGESYKGPFGNRLLKTPLDYKPGFAKAPTSPGLGVEFDEKELTAAVAPG
jgi:L-alanine-DL-glutamate epimerase-like enolase superfamily enzyme